MVRCLKNKKGDFRPYNETPKSLVLSTIKHLKERSAAPLLMLIQLEVKYSIVQMKTRHPALKILNCSIFVGTYQFEVNEVFYSIHMQNASRLLTV
jgi:hypothetical protein